jgi:hypothetical protein
MTILQKSTNDYWGQKPLILQVCCQSDNLCKDKTYPTSGQGKKSLSMNLRSFRTFQRTWPSPKYMNQKKLIGDKNLGMGGKNEEANKTSG